MLSARQLARISPSFPLSHGVPRVDDRRVVSGTVYVIRSEGVRAPIAYDKTLYRQRHRIENMFGRLKDWRRVATATIAAYTFFSASCIAATVAFYLTQ